MLPPGFIQRRWSTAAGRLQPRPTACRSTRSCSCVSLKAVERLRRLFSFHGGSRRQMLLTGLQLYYRNASRESWLASQATRAVGTTQGSATASSSAKRERGASAERIHDVMAPALLKGRATSSARIAYGAIVRRYSPPWAFTRVRLFAAAWTFTACRLDQASAFIPITTFRRPDFSRALFHRRRGQLDLESPSC